jgi:hypothetical protein
MSMTPRVLAAIPLVIAYMWVIHLVFDVWLGGCPR